MESGQQRASRLPSGLLTLVMSDIEGSTRLLEHMGERYGGVRGRHFDLLRQATKEHNGSEVDAYADSYFAVFSSAQEALAAAVRAQRLLASESWPDALQVGVRIGVHTGEPKLVEYPHFGYIGLDVHRTARICAVGNGGQIVLSSATRAALHQSALPAGVTIRDLGTHRLKDVRYPETLYDLSIDGLADTFAPVRTLTNRPTNLPSSPTAFIGRESQIDAVCRLLSHTDTRLVTLTGPGGIGKTRLSLAIAGGLLEVFPDGVFQVPLSSVTEPRLVPPTIAQTLGVPEFPGHSVIDGLKHAIDGRRILLVVDNFEQVVESAGVVAELLGACPQLKILVTSREALGVRFEREYAVPPLGLPHKGLALDDKGLEDSESVRLFLDRVRAFDPDFRLSTDNAAPVAEICRKLEGLPLAIELAASRLRVLSPALLSDRLSSRLDMLDGGLRDSEWRHRTLRNAIAWSYNLLDQSEQRLFRLACVFVGGFGLDSAEGIFTHLDPPLVGVLNGLTSLASKALVRREIIDGEPRLRMLETIREYGVEQLRQSGDYELARTRHAAHFLHLAETMAPELLGRNQRHAVGRLLTEADNIRAALTWSLEQQDAATTGRLLTALLWLWISQGQFTEGQAWIERALEQTERLGPVRERAVVLDVAGWLLMFSGDYAGALPHCERSLGIFEQLGTARDIARTRMTFGITTAVTKGTPEGPQLIMDALAMFKGSADKYGVALAMIALGEGARMGGDEVAAGECYENALEILREMGNIYWPGQLLQNLAHFRLHQGDWRSAVALLEEALDLGREYNYPMIVNLSIAAMAGVALVRGRPQEAARLLGAVDTFLRTLHASFEPTDQADFERNATAAREQLGNDAYAAMFAEGARWTLEQAIGATVPLRS